MHHRRVVITGMGVISPIGRSLKEAWESLLQAKSGITNLGKEFQNLPCQIGGLVKENGVRLDLSKFFSKSELKTMSNSTAFSLLAVKEALTDAQLETMTDELKLKMGIVMGIGMIDLEDICRTNESLKKSYNQVSPFFIPRILPNMSAGQISIKYDLQGPNQTVSTACASGAHAIGDAFKIIQNGNADVMVCGASEACISPLAIASFCRLRALSTSFNDTPEEASRPFDKKREGFVMGEGAAILILESLEHALSRKTNIYAEIIGYGMSADASHLTAPHPNGRGAYLAMKRAVEDADIKLTDVGYINAHSTSTPLGDLIEVKAIKELFGDHAKKLFVSSTKGAHGHLLGAAGNLETVFTARTIEKGVVPPTVNLLDPEEDGVRFVRANPQNWEGRNRIALKNAFGFGGTNACLCIKQFQNP